MQSLMSKRDKMPLDTVIQTGLLVQLENIQGGLHERALKIAIMNHMSVTVSSR